MLAWFKWESDSFGGDKMQPWRSLYLSVNSVHTGSSLARDRRNGAWDNQWFRGPTPINFSQPKHSAKLNENFTVSAWNVIDLCYPKVKGAVRILSLEKLVEKVERHERSGVKKRSKCPIGYRLVSSMSALGNNCFKVSVWPLHWDSLWYDIHILAAFELQNIVVLKCQMTGQFGSLDTALKICSHLSQLRYLW